MLVYWGVVLVESVRAMRDLPTLRDALDRPEADPARAAEMPSVCVIVPAHNEGANIATIARTLLEQDYPHARFVFVLDRCTDDTLSILRATAGGDPRVRILELNHCPPDWVGKVHAVHHAWSNAPEARSSTLICFADADTIWKPQTLRAAVAMMAWRDLGLFSVMTNLTSDAWFEKIIQPVACFELLTQNPPRRANRPVNPRAVANGQFMMFTQATYTAIGTHERFKGEILEDQRIAKFAAMKRHRLGFLMADGLLECRMYRRGEYDRFKRGWKRIFGELAGLRKWKLRWYALRLAVCNVVAPTGVLVGSVLGLVVAISTGHWAAWTIGGLCTVLAAAWLSLLAVGARWGGTPVWTAFMHIPGAFMTVLILLEAARDIARGVGTTWGGRTYVRTPNGGGAATAVEAKPAATLSVPASNIPS